MSSKKLSNRSMRRHSLHTHTHYTSFIVPLQQYYFYYYYMAEETLTSHTHTLHFVYCASSAIRFMLAYLMISLGILLISCAMGKFSSDLCVWGPQYAKAGTAAGPVHIVVNVKYTHSG
jgi:hypothetical protein